jgi:hypothetical protein
MTDGAQFRESKITTKMIEIRHKAVRGLTEFTNGYNTDDKFLP